MAAVDPKRVNSVMDEPEKPTLVEAQESVELGPVIRTETPDGDESAEEMRIRDRHNSRRDVMNAARDYQNGSIDHEEFDRRVARARYRLPD